MAAVGSCLCGCGQPTTVLARSTNGSPKGTARRFIRGHNRNAPRGGRPQLSRKQSAEIIRLYGEGESRNAIKERLGISHVTVTRHLRLHGIEPENRVPEGPRHRRWKGGKGWITKDGYRLIPMSPDHPFAATMRSANRHVIEHRLVMAEHLGRPLDRRETVHHLNGDRADNRIENLQLLIETHPRGARLSCGDCGSHNIVGGEI